MRRVLRLHHGGGVFLVVFRHRGGVVVDRAGNCRARGRERRTRAELPERKAWGWSPLRLTALVTPSAACVFLSSFQVRWAVSLRGFPRIHHEPVVLCRAEFPCQQACGDSGADGKPHAAAESATLRRRLIPPGESKCQCGAPSKLDDRRSVGNIDQVLKWAEVVPRNTKISREIVDTLSLPVQDLHHVLVPVCEIMTNKISFWPKACHIRDTQQVRSLPSPLQPARGGHAKVKSFAKPAGPPGSRWQANV